MNDMTQYIAGQVAEGPVQSDMLTQELERLWLLSALKVGMEQISRGHMVVADDQFFTGMEERLFGNQQEQIIEA